MKIEWKCHECQMKGLPWQLSYYSLLQPRKFGASNDLPLHPVLAVACNLAIAHTKLSVGWILCCHIGNSMCPTEHLCPACAMLGHEA
jgi:hypothetical protein